jgi:hypothetical protein
MANEILTLQAKLQSKSGELRIDHRIVAEGLGFVNSRSKNPATQWRRNILEKYESEFSGLGVVFRTTLDDGTILWYLNEAQVNFAGTLSRNTKEAVKFKYNLVKAFELAKKLLQQRSNAEWIEARDAGKRNRKQETDGIKAFVEYAKSQGSQSAEKYYMSISRMENKALFLVEQKYPNLRDVLGVAELGLMAVADTIVLNALRDGMAQALHYKDIYKLAKQRVETLGAAHGKVTIPLSLIERNLKRSVEPSFKQ